LIECRLDALSTRFLADDFCAFLKPERLTVFGRDDNAASVGDTRTAELVHKA
jgi:hypothetical protein